MFLADKVLNFNTEKLSLDPKFVKSVRGRPTSQIPRLVTVTDATFPDHKYFNALQSSSLFDLVQVPNLNFNIKPGAARHLQKDKNVNPGGSDPKLPKFKIRHDHFANIETALSAKSGSLDLLRHKKFTFVIIDPDSSRSKLVGGDSVIMAHVLQSLKIGMKYLGKNGRILIKVNGIPGLQTEDRFHRMLSGYFSTVEKLELDHLVARGKIGAGNMDRRDRFLLCSGFKTDLPVPK